MNARAALRTCTLTGVMLATSMGRSQDPIHRRFSTADGLASNTVYGVTQDSRGFLWFGTDAGVSRFDGRHFVNYGQREGLPDEEVLHCFEDSRHRVWLLLLNGKLAYIRNDSLFHPGNDPALRTVHGRSGWGRAAEDRAGNIWFGGIWGELIMLDTLGTFHAIDLGGTGEAGGNIVPLVDQEGDLFIQINSDGYVVEHGALRHTFSFTPPGMNPAYTTTADGRLWAASADGLIEIGRTPKPVAVPAAQCGPLDRIRLLVMPGDGMLIYGRWDHGAMIVDTHHGIERTVFTHETINAVLLDDEGNCWLTTAGGGILSFSMDQVGSRIVSEVEGTPLGPITCLHPDAIGGLWLGTENGRVLRFGGSRIATHDLRIGDTRTQKVRALCDDGHWLYATTDLTTVRLPLEGSAPPLTIGCWDRRRDTLSGLAPNKVLTTLHDGTLVGAYYELMRTSDTPAPSFMPYLTKELGYGRYHLLYEDPEHGLWIQRNDMLYRVHGDRLDSLTGLREHAGTQITGMAALSDGTLVMASRGHGVLFLRDGRVILQLREGEGLRSDRCEHVRVNGDTVVVATSEGVDLVIIDRARLPELVVNLLDPGTDHIPTADAAVLRGELYAATSNGLCITNALLRQRLPRAPRLYFSRITNEEISFPPDRYFQLGHDHASLVVDVAVVSLAPTTRMEFQYRIDGGEAWTASRSNSIALVAQEPGEHTLQVQARVAGSAWSDPIIATFAVLPPFWSRTWFRIPALLMLAGLSFLLLRYLARRRYERRMEQLRQREVLAEERQRIAMDLHDDLGADLSGTTMLAEAALLGHQDARETLVDLIARVRGFLPKVDEIIWALDSKHDRLSALFMYLERSSKAKAEAMGVRLEYVAPWRYDDLSIGSDLRRVALLSVKESVNNALKHAECDALELCIELEEGRLRIRVQDNGKGLVLTPASSQRHGMANMQERARRFNGTVVFSDVRPHGTCVTIELPLDEAGSVPLNGAK